MTEAEWLACEDPGVLVRAAEAVPGGRKLRLFYAACCRSAWDEITDSRIRKLIERSEQVADGAMNADTLSKPYWAAVALLREARSKAKFDEAYRWRMELAEAAVEASSMHPTLSVLGLLPRLARGNTSEQARLARDVFPFHPVTFLPEWRTSTVMTLAQTMYDSRDFSAMPILADALQDAGCQNEEILNHCRCVVPHVRGCWVVDSVLGRE